jgi:steroid delta-isomerase-like uncharacterized protein
MANQHLLNRVAEEVFNQRDLDAVNKLFSDDYVMHDPNAAQEIRGRDGFKAYVGRFHQAFPDLEVEQVDQLVDGDRVATRFLIRGTHEGELLGIAPTGTKVTVDGTIISRIESDRIAEEWTVVDTLGLLQQLDAVQIG